jgi:hypothetical protein|tara:strand:- start:2819 stop:3163 length:345 start_codon:yes stop_codon:yes gene_type:complete
MQIQTIHLTPTGVGGVSTSHLVARFYSHFAPSTISGVITNHEPSKSTPIRVPLEQKVARSICVGATTDALRAPTRTRKRAKTKRRRMRNAVEVRKGCATMIQSHRARVDGDLGK